jgi:hypothetical protein
MPGRHSTKRGRYRIELTYADSASRSVGKTLAKTLAQLARDLV